MAKKQSVKSDKKKTIALKKEGNAYDKILKENIEKIFRPLVEKRLGVKIIKSTPLKEKMQTTIELEMDFFYLIEHEEGDPFILHLEFESSDNLESIYRAAEYHGMALRRHKMGIRHVLIYLGDKPPKMRTELYPHEVFTRFDLLDARSLDTTQLISSQIPEEVLMAVLGNYRPEEAEDILRKIISKLKIIIRNKRVLKRYINQLMMLSRLRKIEALTIKIAEEMPIQFDFETDTLYLRGSEKGHQEGHQEGLQEERKKNVLSMWQNGIEPPMIANLLNLPIEQIDRIIAEFQNESSDKGDKK
jgi:predicted transposase YdaD